MLERAVSYTHLFFCNSIFVYTVHTFIGGISMVAPAKQSKHRERSQWTARDIGYVLAKLALARVVTRDLVVSQNKNFDRNPSWSYVKPVVTRGSTVLPMYLSSRILVVGVGANAFSLLPQKLITTCHLLPQELITTCPLLPQDLITTCPLLPQELITTCHLLPQELITTCPRNGRLASHGRSSILTGNISNTSSKLFNIKWRRVAPWLGQFVTNLSLQKPGSHPKESSCEIYGGLNDTGADFSASTLVFIYFPYSVVVSHS
jgi:hypothetical protein